MEFTANRAELLPSIRRLRLVIGRHFESNERSCILMEADKITNTVVFTASRKGCSLQIRHKCRVNESGCGLLFGSIFAKILEKFQDESVTICASDRGVSICNAKTFYEFVNIDPNTYPRPDIMNPGILLDCKDFAGMTSRVLFSVSHGESQNQAFKAVHLAIHDGSFCAESCDGFRLTIVNQSATADEPLDILLPDDTMKTALEVLHGIEHCKIGLCDKMLLILAPNMILCVQTLACTFMNLQQVVQAVQPKYEVELAGSALAIELNRISVGSTLGAYVILHTAKDMLHIEYVGKSNYGEALHSQTELPAHIKIGLPQSGFCYNHRYLKEAASLMKGKTVTLQFDKQGNLLIQTEDKQHLLMPMRRPTDQTSHTKKKKIA